MGVVQDEEIFARVHKYKLFRKEGNIYIDVYEVILGNPPHKYMAVPNLVLQESDPTFFGRGETHKEALKDCLNRIKGVPIQKIVPLEGMEETSADRTQQAPGSGRDIRRS